MAQSRREFVAARFKPLLDRLPVRDSVEGVQALNPGYFALEQIRTEARPKAPETKEQPDRAVMRSKK